MEEVQVHHPDPSLTYLISLEVANLNFLTRGIAIKFFIFTFEGRTDNMVYTRWKRFPFVPQISINKSGKLSVGHSMYTYIEYSHKSKKITDHGLET